MEHPRLLAHIAPDGREQTVRDHCRNTAAYAADALGTLGLSRSAYLAGLLHDMGKCKREFDDYLADAVRQTGTAKRGSVNHTFAGVRYVLEHWHEGQELGYAQIGAELLAFAIGAHHGLFDCVDENRSSGFFHRQTKEGIGYGEAVANFHALCADPAELQELFRQAEQELTPLLQTIAGLSQQEDDVSANRETFFYLGLLARMLLSAVIEGDRRDTAQFMNESAFPHWPEDMTPIWAACLERVEEMLGKFPSSTPIQKARQELSRRCAAFAGRPGGVYRLNVPTGGGKTLSGLRYALNHAKIWNKRRIIFTSPLLSILDQNAQVIREAVHDDSLVLEHHSNVVVPRQDSELLDRWELLAQTWESPIIITTLVQLLNTLFSGQTSAIRRFHALCGSVIVIDEVQTVPSNMLTLFNLAVNFLSRVCGATIILCSATQPCLEAVDHPLLQTPQDMVPWDRELWEVFRRTELHNAGCCRLEELPEVVREELAQCGSLLVVCNKKDEASFLAKALSDGEAEVFHLSAAMCMAHRERTLKALNTALEGSRNGGRKVLCVSTQVIEAGVDISFQRVVRLAAGMDSVIQSAGRCNRHGESDAPGLVCILRCTDEGLSRLKDIRRGQHATIALLDAFEKDPAPFGGDLAGAAAIQYYYQRFYEDMDEEEQDMDTPEHGTIFKLLADNEKYADGHCKEAEDYFLRQAFRLAGRLFQVFDQDTTDVIVPYGPGRTLREALLQADSPYGGRDYRVLRELLEQAKPYTVSLYRYQMERLNTLGAVKGLLDDSVHVLLDGFYDEITGFSLENGMSDYQEV